MNGRKKEIVSLLKKSGALKYGEFELSSGSKSSYYIDIKKASTNPRFLKLVAKELSDMLKGRGKSIAGVALGGVPIAVAASLESGLPYLIVRKKSKKHGSGKRIEGDIQSGDRICVIEDVTTTGKSAMEAVRVLRSTGADVSDVFVIVDREEGASTLFKENDVELHSILSASDLIEEKNNLE